MNINVNSSYGSGIFVLTDDAGKTRLDMIADISNVEYRFNDILSGDDMPDLGAPLGVFPMYSNTQVQTRYVQVATENGTFRFDPSGLRYMPELNVSDLMSAEGFYDKGIVSNVFVPQGNRCMCIIDGNIFNLDFYSNFFGRPFNTYRDAPNVAVKMGMPIGLNYKEVPDYISNNMRKMVVYDTEAKHFAYLYEDYYSSLRSEIYLSPLEDKESDKDIFSWDAGMDFVNSFHSFYGEYGEITTVLTDGAGKYYAYKYNSPAYWRVMDEFEKVARFDISSATDIANAEFFFASATQNYIFYTVGSKVYGIALEGHSNNFMMDLGDQITLVYDAPYYEDEAGQNYVYFATYGGSEGTGSLYKFQINDNINQVGMTAVEGDNGEALKWSGFEKIVSVSHRL